MQIIFDHSIFSLQPQGGISRWWWHHCMSLHSNESNFYHTGFYENNNPQGASLREALSIQESQGGIPKLWPVCKVRVPGIEGGAIFHSSYFRVPGKSNGVRRIVTFHDNTVLNYDSVGSAVKKLLFGRCLAEADGIHCVSETAKNQLLDTYPRLSGHRIKVIHHGLEFPSVEGLRPESIETKLPYVLFVGPRAGYKEGLKALEGISKLDGFQLVFCGGGPPTNEESEYMRERGIASRVQFLGHVTDAGLVWLYQHAFLLWFPSSSEGFGFPALEAAACGCPVLAQNGHAVKEVCGDWVLSADLVTADWLAAETFALSQDNRRRTMLAGSGPALAAKYSWKAYAQSMRAFYSEVLSI